MTSDTSRRASCAALVAAFAWLWTVPPALDAGSEAIEVRPGEPGDLLGPPPRGADAWAFFEPARIRRGTVLDGTGPWFLVARARATPCRGAWPRLLVRVDQRFVGELWFPGTETAERALPLEGVAPGERFVELVMDDDASRFPEDLNLWIEHLRIVAAPDLALAPVSELADAVPMSFGRGITLGGEEVFPGGVVGAVLNVPPGRQVLVHAGGRFFAPPGLRTWLDGAPCGQDGIGERICSMPEGLHVFHATNELETPWPGLVGSVPASVQGVSLQIAAFLTPPRRAAREAHERSTGALAPDGAWMLFENGYVRTRLRAPEGGARRVRLTARATLAAGRGAEVYVLVDGVQRATLLVESSVLVPYEASIALPPGDHEVTVAFTNDGRVRGEDRNLALGELSLE